MPIKHYKNLEIEYTNSDEFHYLYEEIFKKHCYYMELENFSPKILDIGGHIGLATLYFKSIYPEAKITVFEPNPRILKMLEHNIERNKLTDVEIVPKAAWTSDGEIQLYIDEDDQSQWYSTGSLIKGAWRGDQSTKPITVPTISLAEYLQEPVDILKMDIEGAETELIDSVKKYLKNVKHSFIEFHATREHRPEKLIKTLQNAGFELTVYFENQEIPIERMTRRKPTLYLVEGVRG